MTVGLPAVSVCEDVCLLRVRIAPPPPVSPLPLLFSTVSPDLTMEKVESCATNERVPFFFYPAEA